jgi:hypothetical protein
MCLASNSSGRLPSCQSSSSSPSETPACHSRGGDAHHSWRLETLYISRYAIVSGVKRQPFPFINVYTRFEPFSFPFNLPVASNSLQTVCVLSLMCSGGTWREDEQDPLKAEFPPKNVMAQGELSFEKCVYWLSMGRNSRGLVRSIWKLQHRRRNSRI